MSGLFVEVCKTILHYLAFDGKNVHHYYGTIIERIDVVILIMQHSQFEFSFMFFEVPLIYCTYNITSLLLNR